MNLYTAFAMFELFNGMNIPEFYITKRVFEQHLEDGNPLEAVAYIERIQAEFKGRK